MDLKILFKTPIKKTLETLEISEIDKIEENLIQISWYSWTYSIEEKKYFPKNQWVKNG